MTNDLPAIQDMRSDHRIPTEAVKSLESHHPGSPDAIDQLGDGYYELDSTFRYRRVNPAGARLAQKSPEDLLGKHVLDVFPEVETSEVHQAVRRVMASRRPEQVETYYEPLRLWGMNSIYPFRDGVAILSRDITAQKQLERNLSFLAEASKILSSSLMFKRTLRNVAKLAVRHIADWCAVDMLTSPTTVESLAVAHVDPKKVRWAKELRKRNPMDLSRPTGLPNVLHTGRSEFYPVITDEMLVASASDERTLELTRSLGLSSVMIVPLTVRGKVIGAITFVAAQPGQHFTTADLAMAEELASRAALAIENSRLYTESQAAVELRNDFISVASHELRTPVTSLKVYTEVLQRQFERRGDDNTSRYLGKMNAQIEKLTVLISDLLDVSKIESGKLDLRHDRVDLGAMAAEVVETIQATTDKHRIKIQGAVARPVRGDRDRLGQVLTNLLTNAVKYSPQANEITVRLLEQKQGAGIEVEDFGIGMEKEHLSRVFDRFYRVSSPDEKTFPGLGIGLYISNEIVRRHGGTMAVKSTKGSGSVFRFTVPYDGTDEVAMRAGSPAE
jgi:PAS domain S-box-containing protein